MGGKRARGAGRGDASTRRRPPPRSRPQIPVAIFGARFGTTRTLALAAGLWGVTAASMAAVNSAASFYAARLALGLAEAPTFPLIITLLRGFHPTDAGVGAAYSWVHASTLFAAVLGGPIAAAILSMDGVAGLAGWRWLFLLEGMPPLVIAAWILRLPESPATARFLCPAEREALAVAVRDARDDGDAATVKTWPALRATLANWRVAAIGAIELVSSSGRFAAQFFTPLIIEELITGVRSTVKPAAGSHGGGHAEGAPAKRIVASAALSCIPYGLGAAAAVLNAVAAKKASVRWGWGRKWFIVWPAFVCAAGLYGLGPLVSHGPPPAAFLCVVAGMLGFAAYGVTMSLPSTLVPGDALSSALGYAMFTSLAMLGGLLGPAALGAMTQARDGNYSAGGALLASFSLASGIVYALAFRFLVPGGK